MLRDESCEEVVALDRPGFEQLDRHAVTFGGADPHLHRAEADRLAAEDDGAAERAGEEPQRVGAVSERGERDVVEVEAERSRRRETRRDALRRRARPERRRAA